MCVEYALTHIFDNDGIIYEEIVCFDFDYFRCQCLFEKKKKSENCNRTNKASCDNTWNNL